MYLNALSTQLSGFSGSCLTSTLDVLIEFYTLEVILMKNIVIVILICISLCSILFSVKNHAYTTELEKERDKYKTTLTIAEKDKDNKIEKLYNENKKLKHTIEELKEENEELKKVTPQINKGFTGDFWGENAGNLSYNKNGESYMSIMEKAQQKEK